MKAIKDSFQDLKKHGLKLTIIEFLSYLTVFLTLTLFQIVFFKRIGIFIIFL